MINVVASEKGYDNSNKITIKKDNNLYTGKYKKDWILRMLE